MKRRLRGLPRVEVEGFEGVEVALAATPLARLMGLAGRRASPELDLALMLPRTRSVHTFGMAFDLDLIWLDRDGRTVRVDRAVGPRRVRACLAARSVIELPSAGATHRLDALS